MASARAKNLLPLALLAIPSVGQAFDWGSLQSNCSMVKMQHFSAFFAEATAWEGLQSRTQSEIGTLTNKVCPEYLQSANGAKGMGDAGNKLTLEAYIARQSSTYRDAGDTTGKARKGDGYLSSEYDRIAKINESVGWDFTVSSCASSITQARQHYAQVISTVQKLTESSGKACSQLAEKIAAQGPAPSAPRKSGQGAPVIAGQSPKDSSTITGDLKKLNLPQGNTEKISAIATLTRPQKIVSQTILSPTNPFRPGTSLNNPPKEDMVPGQLFQAKSTAEKAAEAKAAREAEIGIPEFGNALAASGSSSGLSSSEELAVSELLHVKSAGGRGPASSSALVASLVEIKPQGNSSQKDSALSSSPGATEGAGTTLFERVRRTLRKHIAL